MSTDDWVLLTESVYLLSFYFPFGSW